MNTITIELCAEDRARLDAIIAGLQQQNNHNCSGCVQAAVTTAVAIAKDPDNVDPAYLNQPENTSQADEHPVDASIAHLEPVATEAPANTEAEPETPKPIEFEVFRGAVARYLAGGGDKAVLRDYLQANFGTGQVSAVPEDKRSEVLKHFNIELN